MVVCPECGRELDRLVIYPTSFSFSVTLLWVEELGGYVHPGLADQAYAHHYQDDGNRRHFVRWRCCYACEPLHELKLEWWRTPMVLVIPDEEQMRLVL